MSEFPTAELHYRYQTIEIGGLNIHVRTLLDLHQFSDPDNEALKLGISSERWPLFGLLWASGEALANLMLEQDIEGKRILEVGCGIALASLVLNHRGGDISASDIHPQVGEFLLENTRINQDVPIPFFQGDWEDESSGLGGFDLIIGSDLLYERSHVIPLAGFIDRHANPSCEVILVDPGRGHHANFSKKMVSLGYTHEQTRTATGNADCPLPSGRILRYQGLKE
jgi:predicted nicotinamide N-methyase